MTSGATPLRKKATCTYATILLHHNSLFLTRVLLPHPHHSTVSLFLLYQHRLEPVAPAPPVPVAKAHCTY